MQTLGDRCYDLIRQMILSGELVCRERISIRQLAAQLQMGSYTPVRDALRRLEDEGMVTIVPQAYTEILYEGPRSVQSW